MVKEKCPLISAISHIVLILLQILMQWCVRVCPCPLCLIIIIYYLEINPSLLLESFTWYNMQQLALVIQALSPWCSASCFGSQLNTYFSSGSLLWYLKPYKIGPSCLRDHLSCNHNLPQWSCSTETMKLK